MAESKTPASTRAVTAANRAAWDEAAPYHKAHAQYAELLAGFARPGYSCLDATLTGRLERLDVAGKNVVQVCCNNGREILSVKNLGAAECLGIDQSAAFLSQAGELAAAGGIDCDFLCSDVYDLPPSLDGRFDIALITIGVFGWMPDLKAFLRIVAGLLRPGGHLVVYEDHPLLNMLDEPKEAPSSDLVVSYFREDPWIEGGSLDYFGNTAYDGPPNHWHFHKLSDIFTACLQAGLAIRDFEEFPHAVGMWEHLENQQAQMPLSYILVTGKAA